MLHDAEIYSYQELFNFPKRPLMLNLWRIVKVKMLEKLS